MIEMPLITRHFAVPSYGKTQFLHFLPCDPNIKKAWMNFIINEVPVCIRKTLICSLHFTADSFLNKTLFDFLERLKLKDDAVTTILNPTVMSQHTSVSDKFFTMRHYYALLQIV